MTSAVFFDMDGTLIDSKADLAATVNHTRRDLGLAELPQETVIGFVGRGARYLLAHAIPEQAGEAVTARFRSHYAEHCCESVTLYPGVRETLEELARRGWLLGINTNKPNFATRAILEKFGLAALFGDAVIAGGDCAEMKPSARPLLDCAARMRGHRLSPQDWMVGDSWTDLDCAANANVKSAFCAYGFGQLGESRYTVRLDRFDELLDYLPTVGVDSNDAASLTSSTQGRFR